MLTSANSQPISGYVLGWRLQGWLKHPRAANEAMGELSYKWHMEIRCGTLRQGWTAAAALACPRYVLYSKPQTSRHQNWTTAWHSAGKPQPGTRGPAGPRSRCTAAPAVHGQAILSAGHGPALDDSRDGTPSRSVRPGNASPITSQYFPLIHAALVWGGRAGGSALAHTPKAPQLLVSHKLKPLSYIPSPRG